MSRRMRQREVAKLVGVSQPTVSAWEKGAVPDYGHLAGIAKFLDLPQSEVSQLAYAARAVGATARRDEQAAQLDRLEQGQRELKEQLADLRRDLMTTRVLLERATLAVS
jgi:transcriptional regulator with XRE-family HTH domain